MRAVLSHNASKEVLKFQFKETKINRVIETSVFRKYVFMHYNGKTTKHETIPISNLSTFPIPPPPPPPPQAVLVFVVPENQCQNQIPQLLEHEKQYPSCTSTFFLLP